MTRIDFYQIGSAETTLEFACRLIDMIYRRGHQIHVHTGDECAAEELDKLLWSWGDDRFIPHELYEEAGIAKIKISANVEPEDHQDVLINLSGKVFLKMTLQAQEIYILLKVLKRWKVLMMIGKMVDGLNYLM